jgi:hypothetical protein
MGAEVGLSSWRTRDLIRVIGIVTGSAPDVLADNSNGTCRASSVPAEHESNELKLHVGPLARIRPQDKYHGGVRLGRSRGRHSAAIGIPPKTTSLGHRQQASMAHALCRALAGGIALERGTRIAVVGALATAVHGMIANVAALG